MAQAYEVIVAGDYCLDLVFTGLPKMPELGVEIVGTGFEMLPGGSYNTAACLHRLGVKTAWAGDFGSDDFSKLVLQKAAQEGMDPSLYVYHDRSLRNITVVASYPHERAFIAFYDPPPKIPAAVKAITSARTEYVYLPGIFSGPELDAALLILRARKIKLIMDGNSTEDTSLSRPATRKAIGSVDVFMPNVLEAQRLTGEADLETAALRLGKIAPLVVIKAGSQGAYAVQAGKIIHRPALDLEALDTTGAGDAFNAGFIKAWLMGLSLEECLDWGNVVGGLSTLAPGGTGKVTCENDVRRVLSKGGV